MGCMIMPCLGLELAANLEKTSMLDKMEPDHIFLLMVRLMKFAFISIYLHALSLWSWLGWAQQRRAHMHRVLAGSISSTHHSPSTWDDRDTALTMVRSRASSGDGVLLASLG